MKYMIAELQFEAKNVWYEEGKIFVLLSDKREIRFPIEMNKKLREANPDQLKNIEIICNGTGLHWPDLDEDLSITGIIEGRLGPA